MSDRRGNPSALGKDFSGFFRASDIRGAPTGRDYERHMVEAPSPRRDCKMQTSREVIDSLLCKRPADRVGLMDSPWEDTLKKWVSQGYPAKANGKPVNAVDHFDFDMVDGETWFDWKPRIGVREIVEETDDWEIVRDGSGASLKWWKNKSGTPEHIHFIMTSREIWENEYRSHVSGSAHARIDEKIDGVAKGLSKRKKQGKWTHYGHQFIWENMRHSMGDLCLYESMLLDPDWIHDYCRVYTDLYKACFKTLIENAGKPDGIWLYEDLGYKERLFCSPEMYAELIFPYYKEMVDFFHSYELPVILHTCGYTEPLLDLIVETGFDGLNPMEVKAGNDPLRIAEKYADKLVFIGGLDARVLESGDRNLIKREVTRLVEGMKSIGARYVYASDHSISTNVDYEDFKYAIEVYKDHMAY